MDPNFAVAHWHLGLAYEQKQVFDAAIEEFQKAISLSGGSPLMKAALGHAYAKSQKKHEANKILGELNELSKQQYVSPYEVSDDLRGAQAIMNRRFNCWRKRTRSTRSTSFIPERVATVQMRSVRIRDFKV